MKYLIIVYHAYVQHREKRRARFFTNFYKIYNYEQEQLREMHGLVTLQRVSRAEHIQRQSLSKLTQQ